MGQVEKYKKITSEVLEKLEKDFNKYPDDAIKYKFIADQEKGEYLLFRDGWEGPRRYYGCIVHVSVTESGKVWLQYDGTDLIIGQQLLDKGVQKNHLVLGFMSVTRRKDSEYAVA